MKHSLALLFLFLFMAPIAFAQEQTTSEEKPPFICPHGSLTTGLHCEGSYCDDISMRCDRNIREVRSIDWSHFASKLRIHIVYCSSGDIDERQGFMSGVACQGDYCDKVAMQCTTLELFVPDHDQCVNTPWFSEEQDWQTWVSAFHFPVSLTCRGDHCDDKRLRTCRIKRRP